MPGYKSIADIIQGRILSGELPDGSYVPSRRELCEIYGVSDMTAARVHKELSARNLVISVKGSGVIVVGPFAEKRMKISEPPPDRVVYLHNYVDFETQKSPRIEAEARTLRSIAKKRGASFSFEYNRKCSRAEAAGMQKGSDPGTGYVVSSVGLMDPFSFGNIILNAPGGRVVLMDAVMPGTYCVLPDYYKGMDQLAEYLFQGGVRSVLYADDFYVLGNMVAAERKYGCELACARRGMRFEIVDSGDYDDIARALKSASPPGAVMFSQDAPAVKFSRTLDSMSLKKRPVVTGFDGYSIMGGLDEIVTIQVDGARTAEAVADILFEGPVNPQIHKVVKVPGRLMIHRVVK